MRPENHVRTATEDAPTDMPASSPVGATLAVARKMVPADGQWPPKQFTAKQRPGLLSHETAGPGVVLQLQGHSSSYSLSRSSTNTEIQLAFASGSFVSIKTPFSSETNTSENSSYCKVGSKN